MNMSYLTLGVVGCILVLWMLYSWLSVRNIEEPTYTTLRSTNEYDVRAYDRYVRAQVTITDAASRSQAVREGFPIIAGYIFGDNTKKDSIAMAVPVNVQDVSYEKIAMTVPVNTTTASDEYIISFVMPRSYTIETLPTPNDTRVTLEDVPEHVVAVRRFSWLRTNAYIATQEQKLEEALVRDGVEILGDATVAQYNPPWTLPWMLRSEVHIPVQER